MYEDRAAEKITERNFSMLSSYPLHQPIPPNVKWQISSLNTILMQKCDCYIGDSKVFIADIRNNTFLKKQETYFFWKNSWHFLKPVVS